MIKFSIADYAIESNRIEGIEHTPMLDKTAWASFLDTPPQNMHLGILLTLVGRLQPDAVIRDKRGLDARVGNHVPPPGGPTIAPKLNQILDRANDIRQMVYPSTKAYDLHHDYETLHPFTDCNGRSGRALWLWTMGGIRRAPLGFLHSWYYQSLRAGDGRKT